MRWLAIVMVLGLAGCDGGLIDAEIGDASVVPADALDHDAAATALEPTAAWALPEASGSTAITAGSAGISETSPAPLGIAAALVALGAPDDPPAWPARTTRAGADPRARFEDLVRACGGAQFDGIAAAGARPGVLAAWSNRHVTLSVDDGRSWRPVLAAPGRLEAVALDDDGTLYTVRDARCLWSRSVVGIVRRSRIPGARRTIAFGAGGGRIAWFGFLAGDPLHATIRYSDDGGQAWSRPTNIDDSYVTEGNWENRVVVLRDRAVLVFAATEAACGGGARWTWRVGENGKFDELPYTLDAFLLGGVGTNGTVYSNDWSCNGGLSNDTLCAATLGASQSTRVMEMDHERSGEFEIAASRERTLAMLGRQLFELAPDHATHLAPVPGGFALVAVDSYGRALGLSNGRVVRRDDDGAWNVLCGS